jgi:5-(carboxyamino)imidazole ribonucleotide synthase
VLERFVDIRTELSVVVARGRDGVCVTLPVAENQHENHILRRTIVPAAVSPAIAARARQIAVSIAEAADLCGVLCVELFVVHTADAGHAAEHAAEQALLLVNELAPRPHNSGHWSVDACSVSQFQLQVRTACNLLPLPQPKLLCVRAEMINLLGDEIDSLDQHWANPNAAVHVYGKTSARPGRKMGHVTILHHE